MNIMDPATIVQLTQGSISLALQGGHAAKALSDIVSKYKYVKLSINSLTLNLDAIQLAWSQIGEWFQRYESTSGLDDRLFLQRLQRSLENGELVIAALEEDLMPYHADILSFRQRSKFLWNGNTLRDHQDRISHQATAMTCLLQAIQLKSSLARDQLLGEAEPMLRKSDESAYSIVPSRMSSRLSTSTMTPRSSVVQDTELTYLPFSFEDELFTARVYKRITNEYLKSRVPAVRSPSAPETTLPAVKFWQNERQTRFHEDFAKEQAREICKRSIQDLIRDEYCERFLQACDDGDSSQVWSHFNSGEIHAMQHANRTDILLEALQVAVTKGHYVIVNMLLNSKVSVNSRPRWRVLQGFHWFPLQLAINNGDNAMTGLLLRAGAIVAPERCGTQPLHIASHIGNLDLMSMLIDAGTFANITDDTGFRPLHLASSYPDRSDQIKFLINAGANINSQNVLARPWQALPIQLACSFGHFSNVQTLLELGARTNLGYTLPLGIAIAYGDITIVELLLDHGADPNLGSKFPPGFCSDKEMGTELIPLSALAISLRSHPDAAALNYTIVNLLNKYGADPSRTDNTGAQFLHYLCKASSTKKLDLKECSDASELVLALLSLPGIDLNTKDGDGRSPLFLAAMKFEFGLVELLWQRGARDCGGISKSSELNRFSSAVRATAREYEHMMEVEKALQDALDVKLKEFERAKGPTGLPGPTTAALELIRELDRL